MIPESTINSKYYKKFLFIVNKSKDNVQQANPNPGVVRVGVDANVYRHHIEKTDNDTSIDDSIVDINNNNPKTFATRAIIESIPTKFLPDNCINYPSNSNDGNTTNEISYLKHNCDTLKLQALRNEIKQQNAISVVKENDPKEVADRLEFEDYSTCQNISRRFNSFYRSLGGCSRLKKWHRTSLMEQHTQSYNTKTEKSPDAALNNNHTSSEITENTDISSTSSKKLNRSISMKIEMEQTSLIVDASAIVHNKKQVASRSASISENDHKSNIKHSHSILKQAFLNNSTINKVSGKKDMSLNSISLKNDFSRKVFDEDKENWSSLLNLMENFGKIDLKETTVTTKRENLPQKAINKEKELESVNQIDFNARNNVANTQSDTVTKNSIIRRDASIYKSKKQLTNSKDCTRLTRTITEVKKNSTNEPVARHDESFYQSNRSASRKIETPKTASIVQSEQEIPVNTLSSSENVINIEKTQSNTILKEVFSNNTNNDRFNEHKGSYSKCRSVRNELTEKFVDGEKENWSSLLNLMENFGKSDLKENITKTKKGEMRNLGSMMSLNTNIKFNGRNNTENHQRNSNTSTDFTTRHNRTQNNLTSNKDRKHQIPNLECTTTKVNNNFQNKPLLEDDDGYHEFNRNLTRNKEKKTSTINLGHTVNKVKNTCNSQPLVSGDGSYQNSDKKLTSSKDTDQTVNLKTIVTKVKKDLSNEPMVRDFKKYPRLESQYIQNNSKNVNEKFVVNMYERPSRTWKPQCSCKHSPDKIKINNKHKKMSHKKTPVKKTVEAETETVYYEMRKLRDIECVKMKEASSALLMIKNNANRRWSEELLAESILLETQLKYKLIVNKIRQSMDAGVDAKKAKIMGSINLSNIQFELTPQAKKTADCTTFYLLVVFHDTNVMTTKPLKATDDGRLNFNETFSLKELPGDFEIKVEIFSITLNTAKPGIVDKLLKRKPKCCSPINKIYYENVNTTELKESSILKPSFKSCAEFTITSKDLGCSSLIMERQHTGGVKSTLRATIRVGHLDLSTKMSGFLTLGKEDEENNVNYWERKWCSLNGNIFSIYNYPQDEEQDKQPVAKINLEYCLVPLLKNPEDCPRKKTFVFRTGRPRSLTDVKFETISKKDNFILTKYYLSADNKEDFDRWTCVLEADLKELELWHKLVFNN